MSDHNFNINHRELLAKYLRPIAHMHQQSLSKRFCLIFGAGCGLELGFPSWKDLLLGLGGNLEGFEEARASALNEASLAQSIVKLFERQFNSTRTQTSLSDASAQRKHTAALNAAWPDHVYSNLYKNVEIGDEDSFTNQTCYYKSFVDVIKNASIAITYNFDDSIERFLAKARQAKDLKSRRGYTTVYDENSQLPTNSPVIYHPNGFLSHRKAEKPSTHLILSEDSFSEQLTDSIAGRHSVIQSELSQKTCLIIGCSLQDPTLNYLLKRNAQNHPGHFHYYVHWTGVDGSNPASQVDQEKLFELYNLITLNLSSEEIKNLADLLSYEASVLMHKIMEVELDAQFTFVVTGAVGSGKSSVISHFRSLRQHDEWLEPRLEGMERQVDDLPAIQIEKIDRWVDQQFSFKNIVLHAPENTVAVHILDRGPLDPLAFAQGGQMMDRALKLQKAMKHKLQKVIVPSHVILLLADPKEMEIRAATRGKQFSEMSLEKQQDALRKIYGTGSGVTVIDTRGLTLHQVVGRVARVIHRDPYVEIDLSARLKEFAEPQQDLL